MPSIKIYSKEQVDDLISGVTPPTVVQTTGSSTTDVMSQNAVTTALGNKADASAVPTVVQTTGTGTTSVMSQDAVTTALGNKADTSALPTLSQLVPSTSGASSGDVLTFDGTDINWSSPGGSTTPQIHKYTTINDFLNDLISHSIFIESSGSGPSIIRYYAPYIKIYVEVRNNDIYTPVDMKLYTQSSNIYIQMNLIGKIDIDTSSSQFYTNYIQFDSTSTTIKDKGARNIIPSQTAGYNAYMENSSGTTSISDFYLIY